MRIFISGGCKNGKSLYAQRLAKQMADTRGLPLYYVATMEPHDGEDNARIARHRAERAGWGFETVEQPRGLCGVFGRCNPRGVFLLDSVTALVANEMFSAAGCDESAGARVAADLTRFLETAENAVLVSDFIYAEAALYEGMTAQYLEALALCDRTAAARCGCVLEVAAATVICHKGELPCA